MPIDLTTDRVIKFYLKRAKNVRIFYKYIIQLHIINRIDNIRVSYDRIRHGFKYFFDIEDKDSELFEDISA